MSNQQDLLNSQPTETAGDIWMKLMAEHVRKILGLGEEWVFSKVDSIAGGAVLQLRGPKQKLSRKCIVSKEKWKELSDKADAIYAARNITVTPKDTTNEQH